MKSYLLSSLLLLVFCLASANAQAQCQVDRGYCRNFAQTHLRLGGTLHGLGSSNTPYMGTTVGLIHEWHLFRFLQLRGELNAQWQGSETDFWKNTDADYFSVNAPLMLQLGLGRGLHAAGGLGVSYLLHTQGGQMPTERFGLDWVALLHYRFCCSRFGLEVRYTHRMGSQVNASPDPATGVQPFNPSSLQAGLTFRF